MSNTNTNGYDPRDPRNDPREPPNRQGDQRGGYDPRSNARDAQPARGGGQQQTQAPAEDEPNISGRYQMRAVKHRFGSAGTGGTQIGVRVRIVDGPHVGRTLLWYGSFTDKSEDITLRGMEALGWRGGDDIFDCRGFYDPAIQAEVNAEGVVEYEKNPKSGRWSNRVTFINGGEITMAKDLTQADEQRFRQHMRGILTRRGGSRGGQPQTQATQQTQAPQQGYRGDPQPTQTQDPWDDQGGPPSGRRTRNENDRW